MFWSRSCKLLPATQCRLAAMLHLIASASAPPAAIAQPALSAAPMAPVVAPAHTPAPILPIDYFPLAPNLQPFTSPPDLSSIPDAPILFLAPMGEDNVKATTETEVFSELLRFHLSAASSKSWINVIPGEHTVLPYQKEDGSHLGRSRTSAQHLHDAHLLHADVVLTGTVATMDGKTVAQLHTFDLRTSASASKRFEQPASNVPQLLREAIVDMAAKCGLNESQSSETGMLRGLPSQETWSTLVQNPPWVYDDFATLAEKDPNCLHLYARAVEVLRKSGTYFANRGLRLAPGDPRFLFAKARVLTYADRPYPALVIHAELLRRFPQSHLLLGSYTHRLQDFYDPDETSRKVPPQMEAAAEMLEQAIAKWPRNWYMRYARAMHAGGMAEYARGAGTADKVAPAGWKAYAEYLKVRQKHLSDAIALRPDCPELLVARLSAADGLALQEERKLVHQILALDPSNTVAEKVVAYSHSAGWDDPRVGFAFYKESVERHATDARALASLASGMVRDLTRMIAFEEADKDDLVLKSNPFVDLFIDTALDAVTSGAAIDDKVAMVLYDTIASRDETTRALALAESGKSGKFSYIFADRERAAGRHDNAIRIARIALNSLRTQEERSTARWTIYQALLAKNNYDEIFKLAEEGLAEAKFEPSYYYMFAVAAERSNKRLDEGWKRAQRAVQLGPGDPEVQALHQRYVARRGGKK